MKAIDVQYIGDIGAGRVIAFVPKNVTTTIYVPDRANPEDYGAGTLRGNSLKRLGIYDGDIAIYLKKFARKQITPKTVCILLAHGEVMAKAVLFKEKPGQLVLRAFGDEPDIELEPDDVNIWGLMTGFQRMWTPGEFILPDPSIPF